MDRVFANPIIRTAIQMMKMDAGVAGVSATPTLHALGLMSVGASQNLLVMELKIVLSQS